MEGKYYRKDRTHSPVPVKVSITQRWGIGNSRLDFSMRCVIPFAYWKTLPKRRRRFNPSALSQSRSRSSKMAFRKREHARVYVAAEVDISPASNLYAAMSANSSTKSPHPHDRKRRYHIPIVPMNVLRTWKLGYNITPGTPPAPKSSHCGAFNLR